MPTSVTINDIKVSLPTLLGASNFHRWYNTWHVSLRGAGLWSVVDDGDKKESRPLKVKHQSMETTETLQTNYDKRNDAAHALIISGVSEELQDLVASVVDEQESARVAMRLLKIKFDHETRKSALNIFTSFLDLKMNDGDDLSVYLSNFDNSIQHIVSRCARSKRPECKALKDFLSIEEVRTMCLFRSLPSSMKNIVDDLSIKDGLKYAETSANLLDIIPERTLVNIPSSKAYFPTSKPNVLDSLRLK